MDTQKQAGFKHIFNELMDVLSGKSDMCYDEMLRTFSLSDYLNIPMDVEEDFGTGCSSSDQGMYFKLDGANNEVCVYMFLASEAPTTVKELTKLGYNINSKFVTYVDSFKYEGVFNGSPSPLGMIHQTNSTDEVIDVLKLMIESTSYALSQKSLSCNRS